jgi:hypothetical protein
LFWRSLCQGMTILTRMNAKIKEDPKKVRDYVQSIQLFLWQPSIDHSLTGTAYTVETEDKV